MSLSEEQRALRLTGLTGSDMAAVIGKSPYNSIGDIVLLKQQLATVVTNHHMKRGTFTEPGILNWYADETGCTVAPSTTLVHPEDKLIIATPDGIATHPDGQRVVEAKSPGRHTEHLWGETGTSDIPVFYLTQVTWQMAVTGIHRADVAALINDDLRIYPVEFNARLFQRMREVAHDFWDRYILGGEEPSPDGSAGYERYLNIKKPQRSDTVDDDESEALIELVRHHQEKNSAYKAAEANLVLAKQRLKQYIGDRAGVKGNACRATYRHNKDSSKVDWRAVAEAAGATPDLVKKFTAIKPGARVLRVYLKETK